MSVYKVKGGGDLNGYKEQWTDDEIERAVSSFSNMLYRYFYAISGNIGDAEDVVSETFIRLMTKALLFTSEEHEKAWLLRTASNVCKIPAFSQTA